MATEFVELAARHCAPCEGGAAPLDDDRAEQLRRSLAGWDRDGRSIVKRFNFVNFHQVMAFVNAVAWIAHRENHHPDLEVSFDSCRLRYTTHAIGGLSENDFICAAKVDALAAT